MRRLFILALTPLILSASCSTAVTPITYVKNLYISAVTRKLSLQGWLPSGRILEAFEYSPTDRWRPTAPRPTGSTVCGELQSFLLPNASTALFSMKQCLLGFTAKFTSSHSIGLSGKQRSLDWQGQLDA